MYGVGQDHPAAMKFEADVGFQWHYMAAGWEMGNSISPVAPHLLHVFDPLRPDNLVRNSADGGKTWTTILNNTAITTTLNSTAIKPDDYDLAGATQKSFVEDFPQMARLLLGTTRVFETKDHRPIRRPGRRSALSFLRVRKFPIST